MGLLQQGFCSSVPVSNIPTSSPHFVGKKYQMQSSEEAGLVSLVIQYRNRKTNISYMLLNKSGIATLPVC